MKKILAVLLSIFSLLSAQDFTKETKQQHDIRMQWWREARFGMFIHWGLYAIPAGEWKEKTEHGEWIRTSAQIPVDEYDKFLTQFNPVKFDAEEWVKLAKNAGMKYIVITSKHHDGFALFDSKVSEFDVMSTPFKKDILKELADACRKHGLKMCWYHSIMDWHHPDYLPRRDWEKTRSIEGADFERYISYMKLQLKELLTNYGDISVLWFDGEWENTWNEKRGLDLYNYVRSLQPNIIINNRVGAARNDMEGFSKDGGFAGDFGTPEQQIPATGLPGVDWESCMTMNEHWGYNKHDKNFKSTKEIIRMLADIASKGGNYLLNVGPTAEGLFPQESVERLKEIGNWMKVNGESIYGTSASPFNNLDWGRCTQKRIGNDTRLYLHVFDLPIDGKLVAGGIMNKVKNVYLLADENKSMLKYEQNENSISISIPNHTLDKINTVVVLDVFGKPDITNPPQIETENDIFISSIDVHLKTDRANVEIRFTLDGTEPTGKSNLAKGNISLSNSSVIIAKCFRNGKAVSPSVRKEIKKVAPLPSKKIELKKNGIAYKYFEGDWNVLPEFEKLTPIEKGIKSNFNISKGRSLDYFGFEFSGYINIPEDDLYTFFTSSDDGSKLYIGEKLVVDNDGLHGLIEKRGVIPLAKGLHSIRVICFDKAGGNDLKVFYKQTGKKKIQIPDEVLFVMDGK